MENVSSSYNDIAAINEPPSNPGNINDGYVPRPVNFNRMMILFMSSIGLGALSVMGFIMGPILDSKGLMIFGGATYLLTLVASIWLGIITLTMFYRAWGCVDSRIARATPGQAIGFLFIPFYNLYWIFQAYAGLAPDYNRSAERHESPIRLTESRFKLFSILCVSTAVPYIGLLACFPLLVVAPKIWKEVADLVNHHANSEENN